MSYEHKACDPEIMLGLTMVSVKIDNNDEEMWFTSDDGRIFKFFHDQACCEQVSIEDVAGDLQDLVGSPILMSEEVKSDPPVGVRECESCTWTFYKFATVKGYVTVRWYGESNGYYSEDVSMYEVTP